ncbi:MarR family transcriptional regulator [Catenulispora sp. NL8]|uniref:MarR family transcriptional regulator n=1 Tax=Catenulispora pinistramenti TaxID=2705254 RepID=A0ABS5L0M1_9ACTN|nr:MarR family transcriptional regulator [Catenulispora pinistramenti]MBS2551700.1 MarR family transcriptional regulator [Catenulispora pinistramenti]
MTATASGTTVTGTPAAPAPVPFGLACGWYALSLLQGRIETHLEHALQAHDLSVREYSLLDVLSAQHDGDGGHLRMNQVADAVVLSQSATTRLVTRLEDRGLLERYLCPTDRRGIYTNVTPAGLALLTEARPTQDAALREALADARTDPRLVPLVETVEQLNRAAKR